MLWSETTLYSSTTACKINESERTTKTPQSSLSIVYTGSLIYRLTDTVIRHNNQWIASFGRPSSTHTGGITLFSKRKIFRDQSLQQLLLSPWGLPVALFACPATKLERALGACVGSIPLCSIQIHSQRCGGSDRRNPPNGCSTDAWSRTVAYPTFERVWYVCAAH